jgi:hypothetical protein
MRVNHTADCGNCAKAALLPIRREQWGGCALCVGLALASTVIGWSFTLSFWLLSPAGTQVVLALTAVSLCCTVVLLLHGVAYGLRAAKQAAATKLPRTD